jgi:hypothetical protein
MTNEDGSLSNEVGDISIKPYTLTKTLGNPNSKYIPLARNNIIDREQYYYLNDSFRQLKRD